jgi:aspartate/methionine/tyrosine aminotransferase
VNTCRAGGSTNGGTALNRRISSRVAALDRETSFEMLARARALEAQGHSIIHLEIGEPDFETPDAIKQAGIDAINKGYTHYGPSAGLAEVRAAFADFTAADRGVAVAPEQVVVTPGGKSVIFFTMLALVDPGDEVLYPNPGFPNYEMTIEFCGGKPVPVPLRDSAGFHIDIEEFESLITPRTRLCVINSPHNPTGAVESRATLERIVELATEHDFWILSDEIYSKIVYDGEHESVYAIPGAAERTILLDGHSKTYAMTGWRLGYGVMPKALASAVGLIAGDSTSCTCTFTQLAGVEALHGSQDSVRVMVDEFRARRDLIVEGLGAIDGMTCHRPNGAFYVFPSVRDLGLGSKAAADLLLDKAGVATLAGSTFGVHGEGHVRLSYATSRENLQRAIAQIRTALSDI